MAVIVAAIVWLARSTIIHFFSRELEKFKLDIKAHHDRELESLRHQYQLEAEKIKARIQSELSSDERIRQEIILWANPILNAVQTIDYRLDNILNHAGYLALDKNYDSSKNINWSITYSYFMNSTLYAFGSYFSWVRMLEEKLSFELFRSHTDKDNFFTALNAVMRALSTFPPPYSCSGRDIQVFRMQQIAIGEMLSKQAQKPACITYDEFLNNLQTPNFQQRLSPLRELLESLTPEDDCRWKRLQSTHEALKSLSELCRKLLNIN